MSTDKITEPFHRWRANEDADTRAFTAKDDCLVCGVRRYNPMPGPRAVKTNAVAAGPCPQRHWMELTDEDLRPYLLDDLDEPSTPAERAIYNELHRGEDTP